MKTDENVEEKRILHDLALEFYRNSGVPDNRYFWRVAMRTVKKILTDAKGVQPQASLFLRLHYPFFDEAVQKILCERHFEISSDVRVPKWYAVEAYLIGEQYALANCNYNPDDFGFYQNLNLIEGAAQEFFLLDLNWFARLLVAITDVFEKIKKSDKYTHAFRMQVWINQFAHTDETPKTWGAKIVKNGRNSLRVSVFNENKSRKKIFQSWIACWESELHRLNHLLGNRITKRMDFKA